MSPEPSAFSPFSGEIVWSPSPDVMNASRLMGFMRAHGLHSLPELQKRSTEDLEWFWNAVLADLGIEFYKPYSKVIDTSAGMPWTRWCIDGEMNIVHNCLDKRVGGSLEHRTAIRWRG